MDSFSKNQKTQNAVTGWQYSYHSRSVTCGGLTVTTVGNQAASGALPGFEIGNSWRFDGKDAELLR